MNITSSFSLYEILRVLIPGFYSMLMVLDCVNRNNCLSELKIEDAGQWLLFTIGAILIGGFLYSFDIPRWFSKCLPTLPSNLIKENNLLQKPENAHKRFEENEYFKFYYQHNSDAKYKTEIQSGFFHLFINLAFVSFVGLLVYAVCCYFTRESNLFLLINLGFLCISVIASFTIYRQKLKYSWIRNYEEFVNSQMNQS